MGKAGDRLMFDECFPGNIRNAATRMNDRYTVGLQWLQQALAKSRVERLELHALDGASDRFMAKAVLFVVRDSRYPVLPACACLSCHDILWQTFSLLGPPRCCVCGRGHWLKSKAHAHLLPLDGSEWL